MLQSEGEQFAWATWASPQGPIVRMENPRRQMPLTFLLDDPAPLRNPMYYQRIQRDYLEEVPNSFVAAFAGMAERTGMRGKFSVLPYPFGLGRIDRSLEGISPADLDEFLEIVRERIASRFDITPEMLTHWNAIDLPTGRLLPLWEHDWSRRQTRETLIPYISLGLEILNNVDLPANGVTSPWDFGMGNEDEYVPAILAAQQAVNGIGLTWFFLDWDGTSRFVPPRIMHLDPEAGTAVVSIFSGDAFDFAWQTQDGVSARIDDLISADGTSGRLVELARAGGPLVFVSHWQSLFSNGSAAGLLALEEVANRANGVFGDAVRWSTASEMARLAATAAATSADARLVERGAPQRVSITAPFACPSFTLSLEAFGIDAEDVRVVSVGDRSMTRAEGDGARPLAVDKWCVQGDRLYLCWDLRTGVTDLTIAAQ